MPHSTPERRGRVARAAAVTAMATALVVSAVSGGTAYGDVRVAPTWHKYVLGPSSSTVTPVAVKTRGAVKHPNALVHGGYPATLTTSAGQTPASILLDFGKDVAGTPYLDIAKLTGSPSLSLVTSESLQAIRTPANTTATAAASAGASSVPVSTTANLEVGNTLTIGSGATAQVRTIDAFDKASATVTFRPSLTADVPAGTKVTSSPGAPTADDSGGLSGFGGTATLAPTSTGKLTGPFRGGFRYVLITLTTPGSISLSGAGADFQAFRATPDDYQGSFESSSDELNRMWYSGAYTVQLDMAHDGLNGLAGNRILDGAKRDRSIWTGDLLVEGPVAIGTLGTAGADYLKSSLDLVLAAQRADGALPGTPDFTPRKTPLFYSDNYSGFGVRAVIDYYRYTGDADYAATKLPALERELQYNAQFMDSNGLVVSNDRDYWQTTQTGEVTAYNLDYYALLQDMAWLETKIGSSSKAADYRAQAETIKTGVNDHLWSPALGAYMQSSTNPNILVEDANALALQYGIVPANEVESVKTALRSLWTSHGATIGTGLKDPYGHTIEPFGNGLETAARFTIGDTAGALDLMGRTWGQMVDPANPLYTGAFWEFLTSDGTVTRAQDSLAHGWAAAPTVQLTEQVLGVTPVEPGYAVWSVKPHPGDLKWSRGTVPTPHGAISVDWTSNPSHFALDVDGPVDTTGMVSVPATANSTVVVDGTTVWAHGRSLGSGAQLSDGYVSVNVGAGSHHIVADRK
ncbi:alpha-L-rhamnosidase C-terminal domain-containing protein [Streptomyces sp. NPDC002205]|uniref:alpha-L-rhamnosidase-related protein n=1 Tax=Streptomyces sp. NPDC002205 TaxID=3154411 RepID=UPI00332A46A1